MGKKKSTKHSIYLNDDLHARLVKAADKDEESISGFIRKMLSKNLPKSK